MKFLIDTDHITSLQHGTGTEFAALSARLLTVDPAEMAFSVVSLHEQTIGCHSHVNRAKKPSKVVRGYAMLERVLDAFALSQVLPFDTDAAISFHDLSGRILRVATMDLRIAAIALARGLEPPETMNAGQSDQASRCCQASGFRL